MRRIMLEIAYDGTAYHGWQIQPGVPTIEAEINKALSSLLGEQVEVIGASRTDSGVHALGNVAVFDTESAFPAEKLCLAVNYRLPDDIRVRSSREVAADFHPRKVNCIKTYEYKILNSRIDIPTSRLYSYHIYYSLDEHLMQEAGKYLIGEHDFVSFCSVNTQVKETVRTIYDLDVVKDGDMITIRVRGNGFLYNMVRIIAGTLIEVGRGKYPPEKVQQILDGRNRNLAGPTAPAHGLTLVKIEYENFINN